MIWMINSVTLIISVQWMFLKIVEASTSTSGESKALVSQQDRSDKVQDLEVKQHHAFVVEVTDIELIKDLCSAICIEKVNRYKHDNDILNQEITKLRYSNSEHKRLEKVFKDTIESSKNDFSKPEMDFSNKECLYHDALKRIDDLSLKLNDVVIQLANTKLTIEKIEHSRSVVYDMIDCQVRKKGNPGIGYHAVEHPFNGNFTSTPSVQQEDVEMELGIGRKPDPTVEYVNVTNPSKSCAVTGLVEGIVEECGSDEEEDGRIFESKFASFKNKLSCFQNGTFSKGDKLKGSLTSTFVKSGTLEREEKQIANGKNHLVKNKNRSLKRESSKPSTSHSNSKQLPQRFPKNEFYSKFDNHHRVFEQKFRREERDCIRRNHIEYDREFVRRDDRRDHSHTENTGYLKRSPPQSSSWFDRSGYAPYARKRTCYTCGKAGHIARNCRHRPHEPYYLQNQRATPREKCYSKPMKIET
ncbi:hypothetical protein L1987_58013 [Smallanthus sonchifolius]|uniref:Uncharacterized protein n=1 Tax=Smallanthus sonchifolius TaxID=185202 RepID=A0ACB9DEG5_9ASTR|nr:hypothetical protein L1987_58013 [Smallanthus sonchifolius]